MSSELIAAERLHGADSVTIHTVHGAVPAEILACDLSIDVAVLKAKTGAPGISAAKPASLAAGDDVLIAGRGESPSTIVCPKTSARGPANLGAGASMT